MFRDLNGKELLILLDIVPSNYLQKILPIFNKQENIFIGSFHQVFFTAEFFKHCSIVPQNSQSNAIILELGNVQFF